MAKKLLEEATVRRFMKIAGLQPLSESFVDTLEEEEEVKEGYMPEEEGEEEMGGEEGEAPAEMEAGEEEVEVEMPPAEMGDEEAPDSDLQSRLMSVIKQLADLADLDLEVEGEEGEAPEAEDEMAPEAPEAPEAGEEVMEEGEHMEETPVDPAGHNLEKMQPMTGSKNAAKDADMSAMPKGKQEHMAESKVLRNQLVEQVAKRVADRLKKMK